MALERLRNLIGPETEPETIKELMSGHNQTRGAAPDGPEKSGTSPINFSVLQTRKSTTSAFAESDPGSKI